jgi:hypothetical protein
MAETADQASYQILDEDLSRQGGRAEPGGLYDANAKNVISITVRLAGRRPNTYSEMFALPARCQVGSLLHLDHAFHRGFGAAKRENQAISDALDFSSLVD